MGGVVTALAAPALGAASGGGILAPLVGTVLSSVLNRPPSAPSPAAPPPPPTLDDAQPTVDPEGAVDRDAARVRALKRRQSAATSILNLESETTGTQKTLTGS